MSDKAHWRRRLRDVRRALPAAERARCATSLAQHVLRHRLVQDVRRVAAFCPLPEEIDVRPLLEGLAQRGVGLFFPRVEASHTLVFAAARLDALVTSAWGIGEPTGPPTALASLDLCLVPGVGFDVVGHRIGMGKGLYDRALASVDIIKVGVGFAACCVPTLPAESFDCTMDYLANEAGVVRCRLSPPENETLA